MGMESFNGVPEPVVPEESERVDDIEKAREMAEASNSTRSGAVEDRKIASGEVDSPRMASYGSEIKNEQDVRDFHAKKAESLDDLADMGENVAGQKFDIAKAEEEGSKE